MQWVALIASIGGGCHHPMSSGGEAKGQSPSLAWEPKTTTTKPSLQAKEPKMATSPRDQACFGADASLEARPSVGFKALLVFGAQSAPYTVVESLRLGDLEARRPLHRTAYKQPESTDPRWPKPEGEALVSSWSRRLLPWCWTGLSVPSMPVSWAASCVAGCTVLCWLLAWDRWARSRNAFMSP